MSSTIGIDLVHLPTFALSLKEGGQEFLDRAFTPDEQRYNQELESLAGIFAMKEAFLKAFDKKQVLFTEIEVRKSATGRPVIHFAMQDDVSSCDGSLSHDGEYVTAICILEHL